MRYASIDILRTIALVVMVLVHFSDNLAGAVLPIAGFGAPLFRIFVWRELCHLVFAAVGAG